MYGNPFSHKPATLAEIRVETRHEAVMRFARWVVTGKDAEHKASPQPIWDAIRANKLNNALPVVCWCAPEVCHGHVIEELRTPAQLEVALSNPEAFIARIEHKILKLAPQRRFF